MPTLDIGFPYKAIPSRRQLINNNSTQIVQISNFKIYPDLSAEVYNIAPQAYFTVYVSGATTSEDTIETVYTIPIVFKVGLFVGDSDIDIFPLQGVTGPKGVRTLSNDIHYYNYHDELGLTSAEQAFNGANRDTVNNDSQSGLNSFYKITNVGAFKLPVGQQLYMDVSATQADGGGLSSVSAAFVADNPTYTEDISTYYHSGQNVNGASQFLELYNSSIEAGSPERKTLESPFLAVTFDYYTPQTPVTAGFKRVNLTGSSYAPSAGEITTSSGDFITLIQNKEFPKTQIVEGVSYPSGKGTLVLNKLLVYSSEYNKSNKAVYDFYKLRSNGVYEPLASRVPIVASSNEYVGNTMKSILSGTSALDLQETFFNSSHYETISLSHRTDSDKDDGEAIVAVCREETLEGTGIQVLTVQHEGSYEQHGGYKITSQTGRKYTYNKSSGRWERS